MFQKYNFIIIQKKGKALKTALPSILAYTLYTNFDAILDFHLQLWSKLKEIGICLCISI